MSRPVGRLACRDRSLRRVWVTTVASFLVAVLAIGGLGLFTLERQDAVFSRTTADLEHEMVALAALDRAVIESAAAALVVVYRIGTEADQVAAHEVYAAGVRDMDEAFERAERSLHTDAELARLAEARTIWGRIEPRIRRSLDEYSDEELAGLLATGDDPFITSIWVEYDALDRQMAEVRSAAIDDLQGRLVQTESTTRLVVPTFVAALAAVLVVALLRARQMSSRVLTPLAQLTRRANAMRDVHSLDEAVDVRRAVTEIRDLAETLAETASSLRISHGLLDRQVHTDLLTQLPNRKAFTERLHEMLADPETERVAVMFIDLDDFKDVNDTLGHAAGDELLEVVGRRLQAATRECEIVARLGGDEFAIALDITDAPAAPTKVSDRILESVEAPMQIQGTQVRVGCSIGIATSDRADATVDGDTLLANADFAMYMAKSQGKHRYEVHSAAMHTEMLARLELRRDLGEAVAGAQFDLHFQPVVDLDGGALLGFEALIRWNHPTRGLVSPDEFISIAEDSGAIIPIGSWVIDRACATLAALHRDHPGLFMSVNVAPAQLSQPDFVSTVLAAVRAHGIAPDRLVLEITEATAMTNTADGVRTLEEVRAHGIHVALDDFGTGFSSLRYLGDLPADVIKIDRSFVTGPGENEVSMLESIITLAQRLGLTVVAEGIEEPSHLDRLRGYERLAGQGYLFARPMPRDEVAAFVAARSGPSRTVGAGGTA